MKGVKYLLLILTSAVFAQDKYCLSHAQCQDFTQESTACYLIQEEDYSEKNQKCSIRCFEITVGSFCNFEKGKNYGVCKDENYKQSQQDLDSSNCSEAVPYKVIESLI